MQTQLLALMRRYLSASWHHRWKALALAWLICLLGWFGVYTIPDRYEARARIFADADAVLSQLLRGITIDSSPTTQVDILQRTILSRPNLERVIARTDLDLRIDSVEAREAMLTNLGQQIRFAPQGRNLFGITYTDHDPRLARDVVQAVLNLFIELATSSDRQQMEGARIFLNQQIAAHEAQLREAEQRRADFRARYLELITDGSGPTGLEQARARMAQMRGDLIDLRQRRDLLRQQLEATPATLALGEMGGPAGESRLAEAERLLRELRLRFTEQHPDVIAARNTVAELRSAGPATSRPSGIVLPRSAGINRANPLYEQVRLRLVDVEAEISSHERRIREAEADVARLEAMARSAPQVQAEYLNLDRDYSVVRKNYEELLVRREALQIAGSARNNAERVRLEVVDPPVLPLTPSSPNRLLFASGVLFAGLGAGAALALLLAYLNSSFYTVRDLRSLGLPVLGSISAILPSNRARTSAAVVGFGSGVLLLVGTYVVMLLGGRELLAKIPDLVAKVIT